jgi:hypothetical protein
MEEGDPMPRQERADERMQGWNVNFHPSTWEALRRIAFEERTTVSFQVRRAVDEYLARRRKKGGGKA